MTMKIIEVVTPVVLDNKEPTIPKTFEQEMKLASTLFEKREDVKIRQSIIEIGTRSIESEYDEALCVADTLRLAIKASQNEATAVVIDCMSDPAVIACREALDIPVVGPNQAAMHTANMLANRFGIITISEEVIPIHEKLAAGYGLLPRLAGVESCGVPAHEISEMIANNKPALFRALGAAAVRLVERGAHALIIGCTGFLGCSSGIRGYTGLIDDNENKNEDDENKNKNKNKNDFENPKKLELLQGIPVIDPIPNAILTAINLCDLGLSQSKMTYPTPDYQKLSGFGKNDKQKEGWPINHTEEQKLKKNANKEEEERKQLRKALALNMTSIN